MINLIIGFISGILLIIAGILCTHYRIQWKKAEEMTKRWMTDCAFAESARIRVADALREKGLEVDSLKKRIKRLLKKYGQEDL